MKNLCFGSVALIALAAAGPAVAADTRAKAPVYKAAPAAVVAAYNWTGCYIGLHAGGVASSVDRFWPVTDHYQLAGTSLSDDYTSIAAGGQVGCNYQVGSWVFGIEATGSLVDGDERTTSAIGPSAGPPPIIFAIETEAIYTITGRLGWAFDRAMLYAKGGFAGTRIRSYIEDSVPGHFSEAEVWHRGWTVGVGVDYMLHPNVIVGVGYDFIRAHKKTHTDIVHGAGVSAPVFYRTDVEADLHRFTASVSYKFGDWGKGPVGKGPVVTRY